MTSREKLAPDCVEFESYAIKTYSDRLRLQTTANGINYLKLYNKRVVALISVNIVPRWDVY